MVTSSLLVCSSTPVVRSNTLRAAKPLSTRIAPLRSTHMATQRRPSVPSPVRASAAAASSSNEDVKGEMLTPSFANRPLVRGLALLATIAAAARSTEFLPAAGLGFVHMLAYGSWLGTLVWTSFIFGIVAFKNLPRQTFGKLQAKLFPKYFALSTAGPAILLGTLYYSTAGAPPQKQLVLLGISVVCSCLNWLFVEPAATGVMFERYELENAATRDEPEIKKLAKQFGKFHGISSLLNLAVLVCAIGHGYYLGAHLAL